MVFTNYDLKFICQTMGNRYIPKRKVLDNYILEFNQQKIR